MQQFRGNWKMGKLSNLCLGCEKNILSTVFKLSLLYNGWYVHVSYGLHMMQKLGHISSGIREVWVLYRWFISGLPQKKSSGSCWNLYFWCCFKGLYSSNTTTKALNQNLNIRQNLTGSIFKISDANFNVLWVGYFNPIPTGLRRNQPLFERHVTKSGWNRVNSIQFGQLCNMAEWLVVGQ